MVDTSMALTSMGVPVASVVEVFIQNQLSPDTRKAYRYDLKNWFDWLGGTEISPTIEDAVAFRQFLDEKFKSRTAQRIFNTCRVFYRFMGGFNPFQALKSPRAVKNRTPEVPDDLLIMRMMSLPKPTEDQLILSLLLNGLRRAEVSDLRHDAIQWSPDYGCDIIKVVGKGQKERLVPASKQTSKAYREFMSLYTSHRPSSKLLRRNSLKHIEYVCEKWTGAAGQKYSPHKLRHHYATRLIRNGVPVLQLSKLLGHESVSTTQVYVQLDLRDLVDASSLDPMNLEVVDVPTKRL